MGFQYLNITEDILQEFVEASNYMYTNSAPITTLATLSEDEEPITLRHPDNYPDDFLPPTLRIPDSVREELTDSDLLAE